MRRPPKDAVTVVFWMPPALSSSFLNTLPYMTYSNASAKVSLPDYLDVGTEGGCGQRTVFSMEAVRVWAIGGGRSFIRAFT
jgi:hypothetical protein